MTDETTPPEADAASDVAMLTPEAVLAAVKTQLQDALAQAATAKDAQLRAAADAENRIRRAERETQATVKFAAEKVLTEFLGVADSLELGLKAAGAVEGPAKALADGMALTHKQLVSALEKFGVKAVDPLGQPFNAEQHQAMSMVNAPGVPPNHVASVMQKGYILHDRLMRPALVVVAKSG